MRATKSASEQQRTAPEALSLETVEIFETYRPVSLGIGYRGRLLSCSLRLARDAVNWCAATRCAGSPDEENKPDYEDTGDDYDFGIEESLFVSLPFVCFSCVGLAHVLHVAVPSSRSVSQRSPGARVSSCRAYEVSR